MRICIDLILTEKRVIDEKLLFLNCMSFSFVYYFIYYSKMLHDVIYLVCEYFWKDVHEFMSVFYFKYHKL